MPAAIPDIHDDLQVFLKSEVVQRLRVSEPTVDRLIATGELTTLRPGRRGVVVQVPAASLRRYIYGDGGGA